MNKLRETILQFLGKTLPDLGFTSEEPEVVMDVGCGLRYLSKNYILPHFPNLREMIVVDVTSGMVEEATARHPHPKIKYVVANVEDRSTLQQWMGEITKLTAVQSFNWLKNQKTGFETVHGLLKSGGEAAFFFALNRPYYDGMIVTGCNPKLRPYFKKADYCIPESYYHHYDSSHYRKMLMDIGFKVIHCVDEVKEDVLPSDKEFRDTFYSMCPLVKHLPENLKGEFKEELFQNILKPNGRTKDGRPINRYKMVEILVRKEE